MSSPFGGKGSGSGSSPRSSTPGDITPLAAGLENLAGGIVNIAGEQTGAAQPFISGGTSQYQAGLAGQLTPAQQALMDFTSGQRDLRTSTTYANMGIPGGATMEMQDKNANSLAELAQQVGIDFQNEQAGIEGARLGEGFLGNAAASLGGAGTELFNAGNILNTQQSGNLQSKSALNNALGSLAGVSSGTQSGGLLGNLGGLFSNSGGGGGLGSLFGKGGGTAVDTGIGSILGGDTGLVGTGAAAGAGGITDTALIDTGLSLAAA